MTSRERIKRAINYQNPDRCPMNLPDPFPNDIVSMGMSGDPDWKPSRTWDIPESEGKIWEDEWGNVWKRFAITTGGEVIEGAIKDWSHLDSYAMPRFDLPVRYEKAKATFAGIPDKYHLAGLPGFPFAIMRYLRKVETFLADVLLYPDEVNELQRRIVDLLKRCLDQWKEAGADGIVYCEDWGTQERLLVSPRMWHEMFEWGYREIVGHAQELGIDVWMHSCGYIKDIIPTLVDIGVKVLQLDQPKLSGLDFLAKHCHGRTAIWSPVDIQKDLPTGDEQYIRACARELIDKLGSGGGGFIGKIYGSPESLGCKAEWQMWAADEFTRYAEAKAGK